MNMAYFRTWRKRNAEVVALAEDSTDREDAFDEMLEDGLSVTGDGTSLLATAEDNEEFSDFEMLSDTESDNDFMFDTPAAESAAQQTGPDLGEELADWATKNGCKRSALNEMLEILRRQGHRLPKDARTLLHTPRKVATVTKCGGSYAYFSIASGILKLLSQNPGICEGEIDLCFNIDGVPLFKSSNTQMWPILCRFRDFSPFIVALYCGHSKPSNIEEYLSDFILELQQLQQEGIVHRDTTYKVVVKAFICDAPARAFLKCIKNHNSYYACERCRTKGTYEGRVVLGSKEPCAVERTEEAFYQMAYKDHQVKTSPLTMAGISCIRQFPLDYMHLVCLGVVRRMLNYMRQGPKTCRLSLQHRNIISNNLESLKGQLPREFARQPRGLQELDRWKATEFRQFLLYTGPLVLRKAVSPVLYKHFLSLMVVMSILLNSKEERDRYLGYARDLAMYFVKKCKRIYGRTFTVYNVHSLIHLPDDVEYFQCPLDDVSSFPFENYLQTLKKMVRQSKNPIAQVTKRLTELEASIKCRHVSKEKFTYVSDTLRDGCFLLENGDFVFIKEKHEDGFFVCDVIRQDDTESFFYEPCDSKLLNICRVRDISRAKRRLILRQQLHRKVVCLPVSREATNSGYVLFPMLHQLEP